MRIGIDLRYLSHNLVGGIHTYLENLIPAMLSVGKEHTFVLYADQKADFEIAALPENAILRVLPYKNALSSIGNDYGIRNWMREDGVDVVHFPANFGFGPAGAPKVITLHDEINIMPLWEIYRGHQKTLRTLAMMTYLHFNTIASLKDCDRVITVSEYSKRQILKYSKLSPERIIPIPHAPPAGVKKVEDAQQIEAVKEKYHIHQEFILADALKNPGVLIRAWKLLPSDLKQDKVIIFFSRRPDIWNVVNEAIAEGIARFVLRPSREELNSLYSSCLAFVYPSWIEGFGLHLLEAMTCGAPIIASDRGAIPEVLGEAGFLVDAEDERKLADYLIELLSNPQERERLRTLGFERVKMYNWNAIAARVLSVYRELV